MKMTIDASMLKKMFEDYTRDYYSFSGCEALINFYDEIDENMEVDIIGICCDCTEYGEHGAACDFADLILDYSYKMKCGGVTLEQWNALNQDEKDDYILELVDTLEDETTVLHVSNGNYIVFTF